MRNKHGQITIYGILQVALTLLYIVAVMPIFTDAIAQLNPQLGTTEKIIVSLIPLFLVMAVIRSIEVYSSPYFYGGR